PRAPARGRGRRRDVAGRPPEPALGRRARGRARALPARAGTVGPKVKVDGGVGFDLARAGEEARESEAAGYDGLWSAETSHDPFLPLVLAAEHTERVELGSGIAVALPRSPMHLANLGWDLQALSQGRFILGLGSQVKAHIEKRFSATWSHPAERMRELILAVRAIWDCWSANATLDFRGEVSRHTLMT